MLKSFLLSAVVLGVVGGSGVAQAEPLCYMVGSRGQMMDLSDMCGVSRNSARVAPTTTTLGRPTAIANKPRLSLVYVGTGYRTYVDLNSFEAQNQGRRAQIRRIFADKRQESPVSITCPAKSVRVSQVTTIEANGNQTSATGGRVVALNKIESQFIAEFLCTNNQQTVQALLN